MAARALWLTGAKTLAFAFSLALPLFLVRRLSPTEFGLYKQVFLVVNTALVLLPLGFGMSAFYFLPRERERQPQVVFHILLFNTIIGLLACLTLIAHPSVLLLLFGEPEMVGYAPLIGVVVLFWVVSSFLDLVAVAHRDTALATTFIVTSQLSRTLLMLAAAVLYGSVRALIYAAIIQGVLQTSVLLLYLRSRWGRFWRSFDWPMLRAQLAYALPLGGAGLLYYLQLDLHNYFVSHRFSAAEYAVYAIGCFQLPLSTILSESVASVLIPHMSSLQKQNDNREIIRVTAQAMRKLAMVYFPLYAFLLVTGREFIALLFTPQYLSSWPIFAINLTLFPLNVLLLDPIMRAYSGQRYFLLRVRAVLLAVSVVALWLGVQRFGLLGAIAVVVSVNLLERATITIRLGRVLGVTPRDAVLLKDTGRLAIAAAAGGMVAWVARSFISEASPLMVLVVCGACLSVAYLAAIRLAGGRFSLRASAWQECG